MVELSPRVIRCRFVSFRGVGQSMIDRLGGHDFSLFLLLNVNIKVNGLIFVEDYYLMIWFLQNGNVGIP